MSLRARLLAGMVVLVAAGLGVTALVTYEEQRSFLLDRVDGQVRTALVPAAFALRLGGRPPARGTGTTPTGAGAPGTIGRRLGLGNLLGDRGTGLGPGASLPPGTYAALLSPAGEVTRSRTFSYGESATSPPRLNARLPLSTSAGDLRVFTVPARGSSGTQYRAAAFRSTSGTVVVAVPLREVQDTLHRLVMVELLVGAAVIVMLLALGWGVIRVGLRPLERIGRVAAEIAEGDLSRRVTPEDPRTEVGRLGRSLNRMLAQIERAFTARSHSEDQLRQFIADASHELRTPLQSIRGYAELFRIGAAEDPEMLARAMSRIEDEAERMGILVDELLALAALDESPHPHRVPVDLRDLAEHAAEDLRVTAPDRHVTVTADDPVVVAGDPGQLARMLANLTANAAVHTPAGTAVEVTVASRSGRAVIAVRDHGPGLPAEGRERLFERFWRADPGRTRGRGGSGLGLAIVKAIAEAHSGQATAGDAPGGGATLTVTLPLARPDSTSQESLSVLTPDSYPDH